MERLTKLPWKTLTFGVAYGLAAEYFEFGSQEWFHQTRPDLLAHMALGYCSSSLGRFFGNNDLSSRLAGFAGITSKEGFDVWRYGTLGAISPTDLIGGMMGILLENYLDLKESLKERS